MKYLLCCALVTATGCDTLFSLDKVTVPPDAAPDAAPDGPPACPADYTTSNGTSRYRLVATSVPFRTAAADCADDEAAGLITGHTHLAVLSDANEAMFLYSLGGNRWLGLSDLAVTGTWRWITNETAPLSPASTDALLWATGEPNNIGTEHCVHFDSFHTNLANNVICGESHTYACECDAFANDISSYP